MIDSTRYPRLSRIDSPADLRRFDETEVRAVADELRAYLAHGAPVGEHLADQLLLPLVMGGGSFVTGRPSTHLETNAAVIRAFGAAAIDISPDPGDPQRRYRVSVQR